MATEAEAPAPEQAGGFAQRMLDGRERLGNKVLHGIPLGPDSPIEL
jgi:hypothetical protein